MHRVRAHLLRAVFALLVPLGALLGAPLGTSACAARHDARPPALEPHAELAGRIWDVRAGAFIEEDALVRALARATYVLLGEKHDNVEHHRLQAEVLRSLVAMGKRPAVAFEVFDVDDQPAIDAFFASRPRSAADLDGLARAVDWDKKGWPPWDEYEPIVRVARDAGLPVVAANMPSRETHAIAREGRGALSPEEIGRFRLDEELPPALAESLRDELVDAHCGQLPASMIPGMMLAQRARDAQMAAKLEAAPGGGGAVLIAGAGHARVDRGVPRVLARDSGGSAAVLSLAFEEVEAGKAEPRAYGARYHADAPPFDYLWFTPRAPDDRDPCAAFHR